MNEKESVVQHAIMEIIGSIAKVEYSAEKQWPELTNFIETTIQTNDGDQNEVFYIIHLKLPGFFYEPASHVYCQHGGFSMQ